MKKRRISKALYVGDVKVGGDAPISVQSMTKTDTRDVGATVEQIRGLEEAGCCTKGSRAGELLPQHPVDTPSVEDSNGQGAGNDH